MPSLSPRTQGMQMPSGVGVDQATALFERGLSDQAYSLLLAKLPELAQDVATFRILDTDLDHGMGVGAFVVLRHDQPLYVPVCIVENALKPLELVYSKALDLFVPLSKAWLDELDKTALSSLGKGVKTPETLYRDVDIRHIMIPPNTGRFSYAAWESVVLADVARVFNRDTLEKVATEPQMLLLEFLGRAPNTVKVAFAAVLKKRPRLLKHASSLYGVKPLLASLTLRREKVATDQTAAKQQYGGGLWIADQETTPTEFRRIFGEKAGEAYAKVRRNGYAAKDDRRRRNRAVVEQPYQHWTEPRQPGLYALFGTDGRPRQAFVMPNPIDLMADSPRYGRRPITPGQRPPPDRVFPFGRPSESPARRMQPEFFAVFEGGDYLQLPRLVAQGNPADEIADGKLPDAVFKDRAGAPRQGLGFFVRRQGSTFQATAPLEIKSVTTDSEGTRRLRVSSPGGFHEKQIFTEAAHPHGSLWMPQGQNIVYLPRDFVWLPLKTRLESGEVFTSPHDLSSWAMSTLPAVGARKVALLSAGAGQFSIGGARALGRVPTLKRVAQEYELPVETVQVLLDKAANERRIEFWVTSTEKLARAQRLLTKQAASDDKSKRKAKPESGEGLDESQDLEADPMGDPAMDPQAAAMMAASSTPPTPSPSDLAAMEMQQQIEQEMLKLQEKAQMLSALTQRTQEIAGGAPVPPMVQTQALGAPPPSQNLATGAPMGMPAPPMAGGTNTPMNGMAGAAPPGVDPSMMGAAPGGALPMAPDDPFGDPTMGAEAPPPPPPMAMMGPDGPSAEALESQINPQFLEQAAALASGDVFDAATLSSLAQSPAVKELVGQYLPNLEKALDNLGRVLLTLWLQEPTLKGDVGEAAFADLEDNLRSTFKNLGDLVLKLSQSGHALRGPNEPAGA